MSQRSQAFGISPKLQEIICLVAQSVVFEEGELLLNKLMGLSISAKQIQRVSERYGALLEEKEEKNIIEETGLKAQKENQLTYVMPDGSMIFTREEGWKEIKLGRVFSGEAITTISKNRNQITDSLYVCHLGEHSHFLNKMENHIERYTNKVCIADGAKWIWNWAQDRYPDMIQILDYFHAVEKLTEYARSQHPTEQAKTIWMEQQKQLLLTDKVADIIIAVEQTPTRTIEAQKSKDVLLTYYTNNKNRMMYQTYKNKGYLIGSGAIESAHRNVIQQRMKLSGQKWGKKGAQQIVNLRAYQKSNMWQDVVDLIKLAA